MSIRIQSLHSPLKISVSAQPKKVWGEFSPPETCLRFSGERRKKVWAKLGLLLGVLGVLGFATVKQKSAPSAVQLPDTQVDEKPSTLLYRTPQEEADLKSYLVMPEEGVLTDKDDVVVAPARHSNVVKPKRPTKKSDYGYLIQGTKYSEVIIYNKAARAIYLDAMGGNDSIAVDGYGYTGVVDAGEGSDGASLRVTNSALSVLGKGGNDYIRYQGHQSFGNLYGEMGNDVIDIQPSYSSTIYADGGYNNDTITVHPGYKSLIIVQGGAGANAVNVVDGKNWKLQGTTSLKNGQKYSVYNHTGGSQLRLYQGKADTVKFLP
jgi:hypothetical protein